MPQEGNVPIATFTDDTVILATGENVEAVNILHINCHQEWQLIANFSVSSLDRLIWA